MNDLIRRSDAIEAITYSHLDNLTREERIAHINALPSADRPQGEWITCSEKMPEESGSYLTWSAIGLVPDHVDKPNTYEGITIASFSKDSRDWFGAEKVYAWMPLPKPWKGADDE